MIGFNVDALDIITGMSRQRRLLISHVVGVSPVDHLVNLRHLLPSSKLQTRIPGSGGFQVQERDGFEFLDLKREKHSFGVDACTE